MSVDVPRYLKERAAAVDEALERLLPPETEPPTTIHKAMRYSVFAGGKRLRPVLVIAGAEAVGGDMDRVMPAACAMECIHTYSLVHDDLPAMDNDDFRRGVPTNHKVFGEAMAILAGDGLLTLAFGLLAEAFGGRGDPAVLRQVLADLAEAAGTRGMVGGQVADLEAEGRPATPEALDFIHLHKTAALIRVSLRMGALICGNPQWLASALQKIDHYARGIRNEPAEAAPATAHLFIINPLSGEGMDNLFSTHPNTENRVAELEKLAAELGAQPPPPSSPDAPETGPWGSAPASGASGPWGSPPDRPRGPWG